jgi:hypothetical protein
VGDRTGAMRTSENAEQRKFRKFNFQKLFGNSGSRPFWHLHESTRRVKRPVLPSRLGVK